MPTPLRRGLRHAHRGFWYLLALAVVLLALLLGGVWQFMRSLENDPLRVAQWLSARAGHTVAFDALETGWTRRGPLLRLDNLRVGEPGQAVNVGDAELVISQYAGLLPGRALSELRVRGLDLTLERDGSGRWRARGLPGEDSSGDPLEALQSLGELQVVGARLAIHAPDLEIDTVLSRVDVRLRVDGERLRAGVRARLRADGVPVDAVLDFDRASGDGRAWFNARRTNLDEWASLLQLAGVRAEAGQGRSQAWLRLQHGRVVEITADAALTGVRLAGSPLHQGQPATAAEFANVDALLRWRMQGRGWRLDAPRLRFAPGNGPQQTLDGLLLAAGEDLALRAEQIDAGALLSVLALSNRVPEELRRWLLQARPDARLSGLELAARSNGPMRVRGRVEGLRFAAVGDAPGLRGLSGELDGDGEGIRLKLDEAALVEFDWPRGFGVVHPVHLRGDVLGWREGDGWRVDTTALRIQGKDFAANARGGLWWQGDGTLPWIDIAARLDTAPVPVAKGFWVHYLMPEAAVEWLDMALVGGQVVNGYALVSGDLDDWPFEDRNGRFEAGGVLRNASLRFQEDWPAATGIDGRVRFIGNGFSVEGNQGQLSGVAINRFRAGIEDFEHSGLLVTAEGRGDAAQMLQLLRNSPLNDEHGQTLANLSASGPASLDFRLDLPTHVPNADPRISGNIQLQGVRLAEREYALDFEQVRGRARYDSGGFRADALQVMHKGEPGQLSLRVGEHVRAAGNAFEAELEARMDAQDLLARAPMLDWLKPHVRGVSPWTIAIALPRDGSGGTQAPSRLRLDSSLLGTTLDLPAPLTKSARTALATRIEADLPLGEGDVQVAFDDVLALRARETGGQTGVRVVLGQNHVAEAPPRSGLAITGSTGQMDAMDWIAVLPGHDDGDGLELQSADVRVASLNMFGSRFANTRVQLLPGQAVTEVRLDGPALAGQLRLPQSSQATVQGRLQRVHFSGPPTASTAAAGSSAGEQGIDPARIPPLDLHVDELRIGNAAIGSASLRTRPVAGGMQIVQLQARGREHSIDIDGEWLARGNSEQTRLAVAVASGDAGALMAGFGMGGQLRGGKGQMRADIRWAGSPAAFNLAGLQGNANLVLENGQLVEIEPGAGRVLGLVGLAQIPRRLTLDFRDIFDKGFAFDRIHGDVRLGGGNARSDNLRIEGPAADIRIRGSANLAAQTYDQTIDVTPNTGNLLPVAGAIAAGPVGAAIGAAANLVLRRPLGQVGAKTYRVTGPWKDPEVRVVQESASAAQPSASTD